MVTPFAPIIRYALTALLKTGDPPKYPQSLFRWTCDRAVRRDSSPLWKTHGGEAGVALVKHNCPTLLALSGHSQISNNKLIMTAIATVDEGSACSEEHSWELD